MVTRVYFPSTGAAAVSPTFGSWADTSDADRLALVTTRISSAMTNKDGHGTAGTGDHLLRQYVSAPLATQTLSGTVKGQIRAAAVGGGSVGPPSIRIAKCDNDGSNVVEILPIRHSGDTGNVPPNPTSTLTNRQFEEGALGSPDTTLNLTSTDISNGDRLIIEIGYHDSSTNTSRYGRYNFGDDSATDLAEDETTTAADNPWAEFSATITFQGSGYTMTADQGSYTMTGQSAEFTIGQRVTAEFGTYSLLGSDARVDVEMDAEAGSYALNGQDVGLFHTDLLVAVQGSYSLLGQNSNMIYSGAAAEAIYNFWRSRRGLLRG